MVKNDQKKRKIIDTLIIALVSLIPFIWVAGGYVILGHDAGKPIDPTMHFLDRLSTWTHRYGIGADQTFAMAGFFIHGFEYLLDRTGLSLSIQQGIEYMTYFFGMGYAMYIFTRKLFPEHPFTALASALLYQINHFVLQAWFIVERTKFTLYIALPIIMLQIIDLSDFKKSVSKSSLITALTLFFLNGGGFLPLYGSLILIVPVFMLTQLRDSSEKKQLLTRYIKYTALTGGISVLLQSYWLLPYMFYISREFGAELTKYGGGSVELWIASISQYASFMNMLRLQGIQEWYVNSQHPYAAIYLQNAGMIFISYLLPLAAFGSIAIAVGKDRRILLSFALLALISLLFMGGSHPPLGGFYIFLIKYVPGFIAFRTPFYKFAPGLWFAYAVLIGYTLNYLATRKYIRAPKLITSICICLLILGYSFPLTGMHFFTYGKNRTNRIQIPSYIFAYNKWAKSRENTFNRLLILPPHPAGSLASDLKWGYWSLAPINSLLDPGSYIDQNLTLTPDEADLVNNLYAQIASDDSSWKKTAEKLSIDGVLLQKDANVPDNDKDYMSPQRVNTFLKKNALEKPIVFGEWEVHRISQTASPIKSATGYYYIINDRPDQPYHILKRLAQQQQPSSILLKKDISHASYLKIADILFPECVNCLLSEQFIGPQDHQMTNLPGSRFYFLKKWWESYQLNHSANTAEKIQLLAFQSTKRLYEYDNMFVFNLPVHKKQYTLELYADTLEQLTQQIQKWNPKEIKSPEKKLIVDVYNTLGIQHSSLKNYIENDYDPSLTDNLSGIDKRIANLSNLLAQKYHFTVDQKHKQFILNYSTPGSYELYIYTPSVSVNTQAKSQIIITKSSNSSIIDIDRTTLWQRAGTLQLSTNDSRLEIEEKQDEVVLTEQSAPITQALHNKDLQKTRINEKNLDSSCLHLPLNALSAEKYQLDIRFSATRDVRVWTFLIDTPATSEKIHRDSGQYMRLRKDKPLDISLKMEIRDPTHFAYLICQFDEQVFVPLQLESLTTKRITNPLIQLVKLNDSFKNSKPRTVRVQKQSLTEYDFTVGAGSIQFIQLDQRYNPNWQLEANGKSISPFLSDGYQNTWIIDASDKKVQNKLRYLPQRIFYYAAAISIVSFLITVFILGKKNKQNNK